MCESCLEGKMTKRSFSAKGTRAIEPLQLVHSDVCGPVSVQARGGYEYFVTFINDYSRYRYVYLMQRKSETFGKFKEFLAEAEKQLGKSLKPFDQIEGVSTSIMSSRTTCWSMELFHSSRHLEHHSRMVLQRGEIGRC